MPSLRNFVLFVAISAAIPAGAQISLSVPNRGDSGVQTQPHKSNNPVDFALSKINPDERDYGQEIEDSRSRLIANTIQNPLFLPLGCAVVLFACAAGMVFHQSKERRHRQIIAARFLAWYHNQLLDARERAQEETERFEKLRKAIDARQIAAAAERSSSNADQEVRIDNNALRQKITLMENAEKTLRQQNTELTRVLREEQQKLQKMRPVKTDAGGGQSAAGKETQHGK
jgi:hypothetical protein